MASVWILHTRLPRARNSDHAYGADRADLVIDLGFTDAPTSKFDALDTFITVFLPITLAGLDASTLESQYLIAQTNRSDSDEWIVHPSEISLATAETMISPRKV